MKNVTPRMGPGGGKKVLRTIWMAPKLTYLAYLPCFYHITLSGQLGPTFNKACPSSAFSKS